MEKRIPASYCGEIDFWKFICCITIVIHHSFQIFGGRVYMGAGSMCVEFFFIVSGFLTASSVARKNQQFEKDKIGTQTVNFLFHKIKGFILYYIFASAICLAVQIITDGAKNTILSESFPLSIVDFLLLNSSGLPHRYIFSASWYLSAMILGLAVIYPIMRKNRDLFVNIIAPLAAIALYSVMLNKDGYIGDPDKWYYIVTKGFLRSIAGLCLGSTAYALCERIKKTEKKRFSGILFSLLEIAAMAFAVTAMHDEKNNLTPVVIFSFFVCVVISASNMSAAAPFFRRPAAVLLGKLSMTVYLCHQAIADIFEFIVNKIPSFKNYIASEPSARFLVLIAYITASLLLGIICLKVCSFILNRIKKSREKKNEAEE